jgi:hypothetical protein
LLDDEDDDDNDVVVVTTVASFIRSVHLWFIVGVYKAASVV